MSTKAGTIQGTQTGAWIGAWIAAIVLAAVLAVLPLVPGLDSNFMRSMLSQMGIAAIFALSFNMLLGQTGLLSFGHAVYFGLGGYIAIRALERYPAEFRAAVGGYAQAATRATRPPTT